ncbi:hypothetical protein [Nesterenkonia muleiensis]|uniref:hypothetical protein n=1 Tax=Nesterenkonia muleiensis TaxID=2282648 RepID=UPI000E729CB2|nr:hypothetical protein [Nesterenkonia muleiensis]
MSDSAQKWESDLQQHGEAVLAVNRSKTFAYLLGCWVFGAVGIWLILSGESTLWGWAAVLLFGVLGTLSLGYQAARPRRVRVRAEEIETPHAGVIPWTAVVRIDEERQATGGRGLLIALRLSAEGLDARDEDRGRKQQVEDLAITATNRAGLGAVDGDALYLPGGLTGGHHAALEWLRSVHQRAVAA